MTIVAAPAFAEKKKRVSAYQNFNLPSTAGRAPGPQGRVYETSKFRLGRSYKLKTPSLNPQQYLFAKEAFLSERRDQAIKLLRQEIDAGYKENLENMLLRLGQLYAEKYMELSYLENEVYSAKLRDHERAKLSNPKAPAPKLDQGRSRQYLGEALKVFYDLEKKYPRHQKIDEVLFFIGFVEIENNKAAKGIRYLERVVRQYPDSRKFDDAVVYLADHYFEKTDFKQASSKYQILINRRNSPMRDYAIYKMAWCRLNLGQARQGLNEMKGLVARLKDTEDKAKFNLREQAIRDLVVFYGETGAVAEAKAFFRENMNREGALKNLRLLADMLRSKARDTEAIAAYTELLEEDPNNPEGPAIQLGIYESLTRMAKPGQAIGHLIQAMERYGETSDFARNYPKDKLDDLKDAHEDLRREGFKAATFHHNAGQKGGNNQHYSYAIQIYEALLKYFPSHPDRKKIAFYRGEALFKQEKWLAAADSYMLASKVPPKDKMTDESVYNALLALDELTAKSNKIEKYDSTRFTEEDMNPRDIPEGEQRFIDVAQLYLKEYPKGGRIVEVHFRTGAIYYRYRHFDKAVTAFKVIPERFPKHKSATTAAHIVLDIHNLKKDYAALDEAATRYAAMPGLGDAKFKGEMAQIRDQLGFKKIESLEKQNKWVEAGNAYLDVYKTNPNGQLAEQSLYNAVISYEKAGNNAKATEVTRMFIAKFPKSSYTQKLTLRLAALAQKRYDFQEAQRLFAGYYQRFPKDPEAKSALYNAAVFAELLQMNRDALELYDEYLKRRFATRDEEKAILISQAKVHGRLGNWSKVSEIYRRLAYRAGSVAEKVGFFAELARHYEKGGRNSDKMQLLKEIRALYLGAKGAKITGIALQYVGEAMFRNVDRLRADFDSIKLRFPPQDLVYLMRKRQNRLNKLAKEYDDVVEVGVPDWGVAALAEKTSAYAGFAKAIRSVEIPARYKGAERTEAEAGLKEIEKTVVLPLEKTAQEVARVCAEKAVEFSVGTSYSSRCFDAIAYEKDQRPPPVPEGLLPRPGYWSTRPYGVEVALK